MAFKEKLKKSYLFFWNALPERNIKNHIRCLIFNIIGDKDIHSSFNNEYFTFDINGIKIKSYYWETRSFYSPDMKGYLRKYKIKPGDIIVDGGASVGLFTIYASKIIGNKGKILAFEPDFEYYGKLKRNLELNYINNVILINKGLWNKKDILEFYNTHRGDSSFVFDKESYIIDSKSLHNKLDITKVEVTTLDHELEKNGLKKVDFIKMDIEGAEMNALYGAKKILKSYPVNLAIASYHIVDGKKTCFALKEILEEMGYMADIEYPVHLTTYGYKK